VDKQTQQEIDNYRHSAGKINYVAKPVQVDPAKPDSLSQVIKTKEDAQRFTDQVTALMLLAKERKSNPNSL
jgi:hypothetical protein